MEGVGSGDGQLGWGVLAKGRGAGAEQEIAQLSELGADDVGGYRNGRIMELVTVDEYNERTCASFRLSDDVDVRFAVTLTGVECSTAAATLGLKAALPQMISSLSSFTP